MCTVCVYGVFKGQKRELGSLELKLQMVVVGTKLKFSTRMKRGPSIPTSLSSTCFSEFILKILIINPENIILKLII